MARTILTAWRQPAPGRSDVAALTVRCSLVLALGLALVGCSGGSMADLQSYVQQVLARKSRQIEPLPEIKPYEVYTYQSSGAKDPFKPFFTQQVAKTENKTGPARACDVRHECERNQEELEQYPLDSLRMVGTLKQDKTMWGLVESPDGILHRVQAGNYMGKHYGKITNILDDHIEVQEIVPDGHGSWHENDASLALVEK